MSSKVGMSKVIFGLYVGNYRDSKDLSQLTQNGITHIIAIHDTARRHFSNKEYLLIPASDDPSTNLIQYFQKCNDFIHRARLGGGKVLVHCLAGMSRSVTVAVAYIMSVTNLGMNEAIRAVQGARPVANPNEGFQRQLHDFEFIRLKGERRRISEKFGETGRLKVPDDESQCLHLALLQRQVSKELFTCSGQCKVLSSCPSGMCRAKMSLFRRKTSSSKSTKMHPGRNDSERHLKFFKQTICSRRMMEGGGRKQRTKKFSVETEHFDFNCKINLFPHVQQTVKRRWSTPTILYHSHLACTARRAMSMPILRSMDIEIYRSSSFGGGIPKEISPDFLLPFPRAFPEVTHAFETEDGIDPLVTVSKNQTRKSISSICALHISNSFSSVIKMSKSLKSLWPSNK